MDLIITAIGSALVTGVIVYGIVGWQIEIADWKLRAAQAVREQAAELLDAAEADVRRVDALTTDTAEHQTIQPSVRVKAGAWWQDVREWAAGAGPDRSQTWAEGELKQLGEKPPLRTKSLPARARRWMFPDTAPSAPTPMLFARLPHDSTRRYRVRTVR